MQLGGATYKDDGNSGRHDGIFLMSVKFGFGVEGIDICGQQVYDVG